MTIDYLKIFVSNQKLIKRLKDHPLLEWIGDREHISHIAEEANDGIIKSGVSKVYKGIVFCFHSGGNNESLNIYFKPHYFFNDNKHNANDFPVKDCINVLKGFLEALEIEEYAEQLIIQNIEYGLNVLSPIDIKDLITFLAYHKKNEFKNDNELLFSKKSYSLSKNGTAGRYLIIKAYAKGLHKMEYADPDLFRFELKSKERARIKTLGIYNFSDLLKVSTYKTLAEDILSEFENILILHHSVNMSKLSSKKRLKLVEMLNTHYWYKQLQKSRNTFNNSKERYHILLNETEYNIHTDIKRIFKEKIDELFYCADSHTPQLNKNCADSNIYIMRNCTINEIGPIKDYLSGLTNTQLEDFQNSTKEEKRVIFSDIIKRHAVELLHDYMKNKYKIKKMDGSNKFYYGEDILHLIDIIIEEIEEKFKPLYLEFNFKHAHIGRNYLGRPAAQVFGYPLDDAVFWFNQSFQVV